MEREKLQALVSLLAKVNGNMEETARELGISRTTLWRWSKKANVKKELSKRMDAEFQSLAFKLYKELAVNAMADDFKSMKLFIELALDRSLDERVRYLVDAGVTPEMYERWYLQFTSQRFSQR